MAVWGNGIKGNIGEQDDGKVLAKEQLKGLQRVLLMILEDIDKLCRKHGLQYVLIGGTAIGCARHKGFIPWDDDVDIAMTRKDYEAFQQIVTVDYPGKYQITDALRENNFGKNIPKLRLMGTIYKTLLKVDPLDQEITVDIFIVENVENNGLLKYLHGVLCLVMGYLLSCRRLADREAYFKEIYPGKDYKSKLMVGKILRFASLDKWAYWNESVYSLCKDHNSKYITVPTDRRHFLGEIFPREIMCDTIDMEYEGRVFKMPKAYDYYLTERYGNYMEVPPPEKQVLSRYSQLSFGKYNEVAFGK